LLDKLYNLYDKVKHNISQWKEITWVDIKANIEEMSGKIEDFAKDCAKLPKTLRAWDAYKELKQEIDDMTDIIPLVEALAKESIRNRHWEAVIELTHEDIPYQSETFNLS